MKQVILFRAKPNLQMISTEVAKRRASALAADANLRLSGLTTPEAAKMLRERWILGEIDVKELIELSKAQILEDLRD